MLLTPTVHTLFFNPHFHLLSTIDDTRYAHRLHAVWFVGRDLHRLGSRLAFCSITVLFADSGLAHLPQQGLLVVQHVGFGCRQQEVDLLLAEGKLKGGELLHPGFNLLGIYRGEMTARHLTRSSKANSVA